MFTVHIAQNGTAWTRFFRTLDELLAFIQDTAEGQLTIWEEGRRWERGVLQQYLATHLSDEEPQETQRQEPVQQVFWRGW